MFNAYYVDLLNIVYCKSSLSYAYLIYFPFHFGPSVQIYLNSLLVSKLIRNSLENKVMTGFCALSIQVTQPVITLFICYTKVITYILKLDSCLSIINMAHLFLVHIHLFSVINKPSYCLSLILLAIEAQATIKSISVLFFKKET